MKPSDPGFQEAFVRDAAAHAQRTVALDLDLATALIVVAQIQLALRHPKNTGPTAETARQFVSGLINRMAVTDVLYQGLLAGFDPAHDVPRSSP